MYGLLVSWSCQPGILEAADEPKGTRPTKRGRMKKPGGLVGEHKSDLYPMANFVGR